MNSAYFKATVEKLTTKPIRKDKIIRYGFLYLRKAIQPLIEDRYYLFCRIDNTKILFKIWVRKEVYDQATIGDNVSIHLSFSYEYSCFHFLPLQDETTTILAKETL